MTDLQLELFEEYKSLDILLKDVLSSETGVSTYINKMEENTKEGRKIYKDWVSDIKRLKNIRHQRNILAHEEQQVRVSEDDIFYLFEFHNKVLADRDPLSLLKNNKKPKEESKKTRNIVNNETIINTNEDNGYDEEEREDNSHIMTILLLVLIFLVSCFLFWAYHKMGGFPWQI